MSINEIRARNRKAFSFPDGINVHGFSIEELYEKIEILKQTQDLADVAYDKAEAKALESSNFAIDSANSALVSKEYSEVSKQEADRAHLSALTAFNAPTTSSVSTTQLTFETGLKTLIVQRDKIFALGQFVLIVSNADPSKYMVGQVVYTEPENGLLTVNVKYLSVLNSTAVSDWTVSVTASDAVIEYFVSIGEANGVFSSGIPRGAAGGVLGGNYPNPDFRVPMATLADLEAHIASLHARTAADIGLENVDNTADIDKPISIAQQQALDQKQALLKSGENIKTINGESVLGAGNIAIVIPEPTPAVAMMTTGPLLVRNNFFTLPSTPLGSVVWNTAQLFLDLTAADMDASGQLLGNRDYLVEEHIVKTIGNQVVFPTAVPDGKYAVVSYLSTPI